VDLAVHGDDFKRFEAEGWSRRAETFDLVVGRVTARVIEPLLDSAHVGAGSRVLDLACGPGHIAAAAAARGAEVVGVDISERMVELARERHPAIGFEVGDAERLPFPSASFDAVLAGFVFNHLPSPEAAMAEIARVLAPGGRVALTVWDEPERARIVGLLADAIREAGIDVDAQVASGPSPYRLADDAEMLKLLTGAGLAGAGVSTYAFDHPAEDADELWEGLLGGSIRTTASVERAAPEARERAREAFGRLLERHRVGDGFAVPAVVKLGSAQRR
jgi:SAM-dependent methyltransferase